MQVPTRLCTATRRLPLTEALPEPPTTGGRPRAPEPLCPTPSHSAPPTCPARTITTADSFSWCCMPPMPATPSPIHCASTSPILLFLTYLHPAAATHPAST